MSAIDHKASAEQLLLQSEKSTGDPTVWILVAQANATLFAAEQTAELVKQQRIANLIALMANGARMVAEGNGSTDAYLKMHSDVNPIIREGLDLS